jgi:hypothetical protein
MLSNNNQYSQYGCSETSVTSHQHMLRNKPREQNDLIDTESEAWNIAVDIAFNCNFSTTKCSCLGCDIFVAWSWRKGESFTFTNCLKVCRIRFNASTGLWKAGQLSRYSYSVRAGRSGARIPVGERFSAPAQTGPWAHPVSYTMGTVSFPWVMQPGRDVDHSHQSSAEVKQRPELYLYSHSGPSWSIPGSILP